MYCIKHILFALKFAAACLVLKQLHLLPSGERNCIALNQSLFLNFFARLQSMREIFAIILVLIWTE